MNTESTNDKIVKVLAEMRNAANLEGNDMNTDSTPRPATTTAELPESDEDIVECQCCFERVPAVFASFNCLADAWICDDCRDNYT